MWDFGGTTNTRLPVLITRSSPLGYRMLSHGSGNCDTKLGIGGTAVENPVWRAEQGRCTETLVAKLRQAEHMQIAAVTSRAGYLILRLRSYPAWRVTVNGRLAANLPSRADGLMAVPVPEGSVDLKVDWMTTEDVIVGRWLSVLSVSAADGTLSPLLLAFTSSQPQTNQIPVKPPCLWQNKTTPQNKGENS